MALFYFNHDGNTETIDSYFDSLGATKLWSIAEAKGCKKNDLIFVHLREERDEWCKLSNQGVYVIFMSTHTPSLGLTGLNNYVHNCEYPADQLSDYPQIKRFINNSSNKPQWDLLKRRLFPETLTAVYLLMVAQMKIGVPLNSLPDEQWKKACEQYNAISEKENEDWSMASEWKEDDVEKVKKKIETLFSPVVSQA